MVYLAEKSGSGANYLMLNEIPGHGPISADEGEDTCLAGIHH